MSQLDFINLNQEEDFMEQKIKELQDAAVDELLAFLRGPKAVRSSKEAKFGVSIASKVFGSTTRLKATDRARDATQIAVLQMISANKEEFKKFAATTIPQLVQKSLLNRPAVEHKKKK